MIREGTEVKWKWGSGYATGTVQEKHEEQITRQIDGSSVSRDGPKTIPAGHQARRFWSDGAAPKRGAAGRLSGGVGRLPIVPRIKRWGATKTAERP